MNRLVSYTGRNEVIVCTEETEEMTVRVYFTEGGRSLDDYDREYHAASVEISFTPRVS